MPEAVRLVKPAIVRRGDEIAHFADHWSVEVRRYPFTLRNAAVIVAATRLLPASLRQAVKQVRVFGDKFVSRLKECRRTRSAPLLQISDELKDRGLFFWRKRIHGVNEVLARHPLASITQPS